MISLVRLALVALLFSWPCLSIAHGYWVELEGSHKVNDVVKVRLFYGEYPEGERMSGNFLDKMKDIKVYLQQPDGGKRELVMIQANDYWEGSFTPTAAGAYMLTGINDTREVQDWTKHNLGITRPIQYLKANYIIGDEPTKYTAALPLDVDLKHTDNEGYTVTVRHNGQPVPSQRMFISAFKGDGENLVTDARGEAKVTLKNPGLYVLSIDFIDKTPGKFKGKKYETVRNRLDYSIHHQ